MHYIRHAATNNRLSQDSRPRSIQQPIGMINELHVKACQTRKFPPTRVNRLPQALCSGKIHQGRMTLSLISKFIHRETGLAQLNTQPEHQINQISPSLWRLLKNVNTLWKNLVRFEIDLGSRTTQRNDWNMATFFLCLTYQMPPAKNKSMHRLNRSLKHTTSDLLIVEPRQ